MAPAAYSSSRLSSPGSTVVASSPPVHRLTSAFEPASMSVLGQRWRLETPDSPDDPRGIDAPGSKRRLPPNH
jgi:hypothetical protein